MKQMKTLILALGGLALSASALDFGPGWEIVIPDPDTRGVQVNIWSLSEEFARDLKKSVGLSVPVRFASKSEHPAHAIYVGAEFAEKAGLLPADMKGFSNGIAEKDGNVYFFGRDVSCRTIGKGEWPSQNLMSLPSIRAMTRFMYTFMGVRFVMPGANGRAVPKLSSLTIPDGYFDREDPEFDYMAGRTFDRLNGLGRGHFGRGVYHTYGGHTYSPAVPKELFGAHPEYFMLRNGKRTLGPTSGQTGLCISNPDVRKLIVAEILRRLDAGSEVCQLGQHDGSLVCQCAPCRALYGTGDDWNEKLWIFHRNIAEDVLKARPGKAVHILCYDLTHDPPKTFRKFPSNVSIELCDTSEESFRQWEGYEVPRGFTAYIYLWGEYPPPGFTAKRSFAGLASFVRRLRARRVHGVYRCGFGELPGMEGPAYYLFDRLLQDGNADIEATVKEFCDAAFGTEAGEPMKRFYEALDTRLRMFDAMSMGHFEADAPGVSKYLKALPGRTLDLLQYFYTPETLNVMEGCLRHAERATMTDVERIRLQRVRVEFDYARNLGRIALLYSAYLANPGKTTFLPLAEELRWRNAFLDRICDEKGAVRKSADWPESDATLFGGHPKAMLKANGRLSAVIGDPLGWDVDRMLAEEYFPGAPEGVARRKAYDAEHCPQRMTNFTVYGDGEGVRLTVRPDKSGCVFETLPGAKGARVVASGHPKDGPLKPDTDYRVSWFARYEDVIPPKSKSGGFCAVIQAGKGLAFMEPSAMSGLSGTSDWRHMSCTFRTKESPWKNCEVIFRILDTQGRVEIEDVTIEELN